MKLSRMFPSIATLALALSVAISVVCAAPSFHPSPGLELASTMQSTDHSLFQAAYAASPAPQLAPHGVDLVLHDACLGTNMARTSSHQSASAVCLRDLNHIQPVSTHLIGSATFLESGRMSYLRS